MPTWNIKRFQQHPENCTSQLYTKYLYIYNILCRVSKWLDTLMLLQTAHKCSPDSPSPKQKNKQTNQTNLVILGSLKPLPVLLHKSLRDFIAQLSCHSNDQPIAQDLGLCGRSMVAWCLHPDYGELSTRQHVRVYSPGDC